MQTLDLPRELERPLATGHPWVYRNHVPPGFAAPSGTWLRLSAGRFNGYGLWDAESPIAIRIFSTEQPPDAAWFAARIEEAWLLRAPLRQRKTSAYRWLFGEADRLPGLTVDIYGAFAVVLTYAPSLEALLPEIALALQRAAPLHGVVWRQSKAEANPEAGQSKLRLLLGRLPPRRLIVEENDVRFAVDLHVGQKSGLFLDQRDNRSYVRGIAKERRVLNLFAYTGGFSLAAALGGASHVTSVDVSSAAMEALRANCTLNGLPLEQQRCVSEDAFEFLEREVRARQSYDLVVCDPPSFARNKNQLPQARKAYTRLNTLALKATEVGGLYASASCTAQLSPDGFHEILDAAARGAQRRLQIIHEAAHALDHPLLSGHAEGRYLKFVVARVLARA